MHSLGNRCPLPRAARCDGRSLKTDRSPMPAAAADRHQPMKHPKINTRIRDRLTTTSLQLKRPPLLLGQPISPQRPLERVPKAWTQQSKELPKTLRREAPAAAPDHRVHKGEGASSSSRESSSAQGVQEWAALPLRRRPMHPGSPLQLSGRTPPTEPGLETSATIRSHLSDPPCAASRPDDCGERRLNTP